MPGESDESAQPPELTDTEVIEADLQAAQADLREAGSVLLQALDALDDAPMVGEA